MRLRDVRVHDKTRKALCTFDLQLSLEKRRRALLLRQARGETEEKLDQAVRLAVVYSGYRSMSEALGLVSQLFPLTIVRRSTRSIVGVMQAQNNSSSLFQEYWQGNSVKACIVRL